MFHPYLKKVIWGGTNICAFKGVSSDATDIGESWEVSAVEGHESVVSEGPYMGMPLTELVERFGDSLLGSRVTARYGRQFPLLIKYIDTADKLSVQVHPDDALAARRHASRGKTEMWYVIDTRPGAKVFSGLNKDLTPCEFVSSVADHTFVDHLEEQPSNPGDIFYIPAGRVHAIGAGNFLVEIQESSDITYRIYDYGRRDADGRLRELHPELALEAIDFSAQEHRKCHSVPDDATDAPLVECSHFKVRRIIVDGFRPLPMPEGSLMVVMCIAGDVMLRYPGGELQLTQGRTALIPANLRQLTVEGKGRMLTACP